MDEPERYECDTCGIAIHQFVGPSGLDVGEHGGLWCADCSRTMRRVH